MEGSGAITIKDEVQLAEETRGISPSGSTLIPAGEDEKNEDAKSNKPTRMQ